VSIDYVNSSIKFSQQEKEKQVNKWKLARLESCCSQQLSPRSNEKHCRSLTACMDMLNSETARARYIFFPISSRAVLFRVGRCGIDK
jgi:hypothetical protein